jgi:predicted nucleic acid-binding protein
LDQQGILDTSAVIALGRITDASLLPETPLITAVTLAELAVGPLIAEDESVRADRQTHLLFAEQNFDPLPFDREAARAFAGVAASLRRAGRKTSARAYDAMIAATAVACGLPVYTCNPRDFEAIDGLTVVAIDAPPA